jgi:Cu/Ag efflux protein CusF
MRVDRKIAVLSLAVLTLAACSRPEANPPQKQYPLTGRIVSIDVKSRTAMVDAAAVPNFMDAMKMEYPVASGADLASLKAGENISATVNVSEDGSYSLSNIHERAAEAGK